jgi:hypothetical protein
MAIRVIQQNKQNITITMTEENNYSDEVLKQQEAIRQSGVINMFDKRGVKRHADDMGFNELVTFIEDANASEYTEMASKAAEKHRQ